MKEKVRRLAPTPTVLRELYLKSGNQCAFPGCKELIIDNQGVFIGEVCHIEAAMPGGERFNKNQTNEDRRKFENLMLMCHKHHKITDNVDEYTVKKLKAIKKEHENKYTEIEKKISEKIKDYTKKEVLNNPKTLNAMNKYFKWNLSKEELDVTMNDVINFGSKIKNLPKESKELLVIICERVEEETRGFRKKFKVPVIEIIQACNIEDNYFKNSFSVLEKYNLCVIEEDWDGIEKIYLGTGAYDNWWGDIIIYCREKNLELSEVLVDLNFTVLD